MEKALAYGRSRLLRHMKDFRGDVCRVLGCAIFASKTTPAAAAALQSGGEERLQPRPPKARTRGSASAAVVPYIVDSWKKCIESFRRAFCAMGVMLPVPESAEKGGLRPTAADAAASSKPPLDSRVVPSPTAPQTPGASGGNLVQNFALFPRATVEASVGEASSGAQLQQTTARRQAPRRGGTEEQQQQRGTAALLGNPSPGSGRRRGDEEGGGGGGRGFGRRSRRSTRRTHSAAVSAPGRQRVGLLQSSQTEANRSPSAATTTTSATTNPLPLSTPQVLPEVWTSAGPPYPPPPRPRLQQPPPQPHQPQQQQPHQAQQQQPHQPQQQQPQHLFHHRRQTLQTRQPPQQPPYRIPSPAGGRRGQRQPPWSVMATPQSPRLGDLPPLPQPDARQLASDLEAVFGESPQQRLSASARQGRRSEGGGEAATFASPTRARSAESALSLWQFAAEAETSLGSGGVARRRRVLREPSGSAAGGATAFGLGRGRRGGPLEGGARRESGESGGQSFLRLLQGRRGGGEGPSSPLGVASSEGWDWFFGLPSRSSPPSSEGEAAATPAAALPLWRRELASFLHTSPSSRDSSSEEGSLVDRRREALRWRREEPEERQGRGGRGEAGNEGEAAVSQREPRGDAPAGPERRTTFAFSLPTRSSAARRRSGKCDKDSKTRNFAAPQRSSWALPDVQLAQAKAGQVLEAVLASPNLEAFFNSCLLASAVPSSASLRSQCLNGEALPHQGRNLREAKEKPNCFFDDRFQEAPFAGGALWLEALEGFVARSAVPLHNQPQPEAESYTAALSEVDGSPADAMTTDASLQCVAVSFDCFPASSPPKLKAAERGAQSRRRAPPLPFGNNGLLRQALEERLAGTAAQRGEEESRGLCLTTASLPLATFSPGASLSAQTGAASLGGRRMEWRFVARPTGGAGGGVGEKGKGAEEAEINAPAPPPLQVGEAPSASETAGAGDEAQLWRRLAELVQCTVLRLRARRRWIFEDLRPRLLNEARSLFAGSVGGHVAADAEVSRKLGVYDEKLAAKVSDAENLLQDIRRRAE